MLLQTIAMLLRILKVKPPERSEPMSTLSPIEVYQPKYPLRIVTAASLFDGHDAAINIMRRILQSSGSEVIHLGHNRSVAEIVDCAIQEDAQAIAVTSYQGGHVEYFKYMHKNIGKLKNHDFRTKPAHK